MAKTGSPATAKSPAPAEKTADPAPAAQSANPADTEANAGAAEQTANPADTEATPAAEAEALFTAATDEPQDESKNTGITVRSLTVQSILNHDGELYAPGDVVDMDKFSDDQLGTLIALGVVEFN